MPPRAGLPSASMNCGLITKFLNSISDTKRRQAFSEVIIPLRGARTAGNGGGGLKCTNCRACLASYLELQSFDLTPLRSSQKPKRKVLDDGDLGSKGGDHEPEKKELWRASIFIGKSLLSTFFYWASQVLAKSQAFLLPRCKVCLLV
jgi:hypothetical protein